MNDSGDLIGIFAVQWDTAERDVVELLDRDPKRKIRRQAEDLVPRCHDIRRREVGECEGSFDELFLALFDGPLFLTVACHADQFRLSNGWIFPAA